MRHLSIIIVALALVGVIWWLSHGEVAHPHVAPMTAETSDTPASEVVDPTAATLSGQAADARTELTVTTDPAPKSSVGEAFTTTTIIRGRCVDAAGAPLPGVYASLQGYIASQQSIEAYNRNPPRSVWSDPDPVKTGTDGRFEFRITPPQHHSFALFLVPLQFGEMRRDWGKLQNEKVIDLGDIAFRGGVTVSGRIVDTEGAPQEEVDLTLSRSDDTGPGGSPTEWTASALSGHDGTFTFAQELTPGTWTLAVDDLNRVTPKSNQVTIASPGHVLDVVVEAPIPMVAIEGIVVDTAGAPVSWATVTIVEGGSPNWEFTNQTGPDGRFVIRRPASEVGPEKFALDVRSDHHEPLLTDAVHTFGEKHVRFVLSDGLPLEVVVSRDADGTPVDYFSVRLLPKPGSRTNSTFSDRRFRGPRYENGLARLTGIPRGPYLLSVEPARSPGLCGMYLVETNVGDGAPSVVHVRLEETFAQRVVVERSDGSVVAGSEVELLLAAPGVPITIEARAWTFSDEGPGFNTRLLRVHTATTGADGSCELRGARSQLYGVRVSGKGHMTKVITDVRLDLADPLRIVVQSGATLIGRLTPAEIVQDFRELANLPRTGPIAEHRWSRLAPSVYLRRMVGGRIQRVPSGQTGRGVPVAEDGTFVIDGISAGTWDLYMTAYRATERGASQTNMLLHAGITFDDEESKKSTFDVVSRQYGRLRATVMLDGEPYEGSVQMLGLEDGASLEATADAHGRFEAMLAPGRWTAQPGRRLTSRSFARFRPPEIATVPPGGIAEATFRAQSARAKVRVLLPDGAPAVGVPVMVDVGLSGADVFAATTDGDGTFEVFLAPGSYGVRARVRVLISDQVWNTFQRVARSPAEVEGAHVRIGDVTLPAAEVVTLRLPVGW